MEHNEWVLVPIEPTPEMLSAAHYELADKPFSNNAERSARAYAAMLAAAPQPPVEAQPCGCGEATCTVPWEPGCGLGKSEQHAEAQPVAWFPTYGNGKLVRNYGDGSPVPASKTKEEAEQAKRCHLGATGPVIPLYAHPPPSAPVGVEGLPEKWRREAPRARVDVGEDASLAWREAVYWCAFQLEAALAQQPAAVDGESVIIDGRRYDLDTVRTALLGLAADVTRDAAQQGGDT